MISNCIKNYIERLVEYNNGITRLYISENEYAIIDKNNTKVSFYKNKVKQEFNIYEKNKEYIIQLHKIRELKQSDIQFELLRKHEGKCVFSTVNTFELEGSAKRSYSDKVTLSKFEYGEWKTYIIHPIYSIKFTYKNKTVHYIINDRAYDYILSDTERFSDYLTRFKDHVVDLKFMEVLQLYMYGEANIFKEKIKGLDVLISVDEYNRCVSKINFGNKNIKTWRVDFIRDKHMYFRENLIQEIDKKANIIAHKLNLTLRNI